MATQSRIEELEKKLLDGEVWNDVDFVWCSEPCATFKDLQTKLLDGEVEPSMTYEDLPKRDRIITARDE